MENGIKEPLYIRKMSPLRDSNMANGLNLTKGEAGDQSPTFNSPDYFHAPILWKCSNLVDEIYSTKTEDDDLSDYSEETIQNLLDLGSIDHSEDESLSSEFGAVINKPLKCQNLSTEDTENGILSIESAKQISLIDLGSTEHSEDESSSSKFEAVIQNPLKWRNFVKEDTENGIMSAGWAEPRAERTSVIGISSDILNSEEHQQRTMNSSLFNCPMSSEDVKCGNEANFTTTSSGHEVYSCKICGQGFLSKSNVKNHAMMEHIVNESTFAKPFSCNVCGVGFNEESCLEIHAKMHQRHESFCCNDCGKKFSNKKTLIKHLKTHSEDSNQESEFLLGISDQFASSNYSECEIRLDSNDGPSLNGIGEKRFGCNREVKVQTKSKTPGRPFICNFCGKEFKHKRSQKAHLSTHTGEEPYPCNICGKRFRQFSGLSQHMKSHAREKCFRCDVCGRSFAYKHVLTMHSLIHTGQKPFPCDICDKSFRQLSTLNQHMRLHIGEKCFRDKFCDENFNLKHRLPTQSRLHASNQPFSCVRENERRQNISDRLENEEVKNSEYLRGDSCQNDYVQLKKLRIPLTRYTPDRLLSPSRKLVNEENLKIPTKTCISQKLPSPCSNGDESYISKRSSNELSEMQAPFTEEYDPYRSYRSQPVGTFSENTNARFLDEREQFSCRICCKSFYRNSELRRHLIVHTGEKPFSCDVCGKYFTQKGNLTAHLRIHTGERPFRCDVCGAAFNHKRVLSNHLLIHTGEKAFSCEVCNKKFRLKNHLASHVFVHTLEKRFSCDFCGKTFKRKNDVRIHSLSHASKQPFSCEYCGKGFTQQCHLSKHIRTHTGERPFSCEVCGKSFAQKSNLTAHNRIHIRKKPYLCKFCGRAFARNDSLGKHLRTHSRKAPFSCDLCQLGFKRKIDLTHHLQTHTDDTSFLCKLCGRVFNRAFGLKRHLRRHTDDKRFSCEDCGKKFSYKSVLKNHIMVVHQNQESMCKKSQLCTICNKTFTCMKNLKLHSRWHANDNFSTSKMTSKEAIDEDLQINDSRSLVEEEPALSSRCCELFNGGDDFKMHLGLLASIETTTRKRSHNIALVDQEVEALRSMNNRIKMADDIEIDMKFESDDVKEETSEISR